MKCLAQNKAVNYWLIKYEKVMRNLHCPVHSKKLDPKRDTIINPRSITAPFQNLVKNTELKKTSGRQILL